MVYTENEISPLQIEWVCLDNKKIDSQPQTILERTNTFYYHILIANEEADSKACISYLPFFPHLFQLKRSRIEKKILTFYFCTDSNKSNCLKSNCTDSNKSTFAHKGYHDYINFLFCWPVWGPNIAYILFRRILTCHGYPCKHKGNLREYKNSVHKIAKL